MPTQLLILLTSTMLKLLSPLLVAGANVPSAENKLPPTVFDLLSALISPGKFQQYKELGQPYDIWHLITLGAIGLVLLFLPININVQDTPKESKKIKSKIKE